MVEILHVSTAAEIKGVQDLVREFADWAFSMSQDARQAPTFTGLDAELAALPGKYAAPTGCLLLAIHAGEPAGCLAVRRHDDTTAEVKRMYVRPAARGQGIGGALLNELIAASRQMDYRRMVLTTHPKLESAISLYEAAGFVIVQNPANFPQHSDIEICMEMPLP